MTNPASWNAVSKTAYLQNHIAMHALRYQFRLKLILYCKFRQFNFALLNGIIVTNYFDISRKMN